MSSTRLLFLTTAAALLATLILPVLAATPPGYLNYQGVLRDGADNPLDGTYDMVFRFYGPSSVEIMIDRHTGAQGGPVTVTDGLFNVILGAGSTADGSGPGSYGNLAEVFRDNHEVYLEVQIGADAAPDKEILAPRTRVFSAAYALNAANLAGLPVTSLLRSNETDAYTFGTLTFDPVTTLDVNGTLRMDGAVTKATTDRVVNFNADRLDDLDSSAFSLTGHGHAGTDISGQVAQAANADTLDGYHWSVFSLTGHDHAGADILGQVAESGNAGLLDYFDSSQFVRSDATAIKNSGDLKFSSGVRLLVDDGSEAAPGLGFRWYPSSGITTNGAGHVTLVTGGTTGLDVGVNGDTNISGRLFLQGDTTNQSLISLNYGGPDETQSILFYDHGTWQGQHIRWDDPADRFTFSDDVDVSGNLTTPKLIANEGGDTAAWIGGPFYGVEATGTWGAGYFLERGGASDAFLGYYGYGIFGRGDTMGGRFQASSGNGDAYLGYGNRGIWGRGTFAGGTFSYTDDVTVWADVAKWDGSGSHYTITGNGQKNFVQNHPEDPTKVVVYASLEGDEVGTYTRGSARLVGGEARVAIGETFRWVTHPDVGLTAHVTPRGPDAVVYVESVTTEELVVRNVSGFADDAAFDYVVMGLRIGFESSSAVRDKDREAPIPDAGLAEAHYAERPELRAYTPLARFTEMTADLRGVSPGDLNLSGAATLKAAIREAGHLEIGKSTGEPQTLATPPEQERAAAEPPVANLGVTPNVGDAPADDTDARSLYPLFAVSEAVEPGDLLVLDPDDPGHLRRSVSAIDSNVIGIVSGDLVADDGNLRAPVALSDLALLKADAGYGEIRPGDLLTSSYTAGHAMRAGEIIPGTIIGKALEPLQTGTGLIKVLVMPR